MKVELSFHDYNIMRKLLCDKVIKVLIVLSMFRSLEGMLSNGGHICNAFFSM